MRSQELFELATRASLEGVRDSLNLTERQLEIFNLRYQKGYMAVKIADILCLSEHTIYKEQSRILKKLAKVDLSELQGD